MDVVINNNGTLEDTATSNISNITTVISIIITTVNGGSRRNMSRAPGPVSFFKYYFKLQIPFEHAWQPYDHHDHQYHEHEHDDHHHQQY